MPALHRDPRERLLRRSEGVHMALCRQRILGGCGVAERDLHIGADEVDEPTPHLLRADDEHDVVLLRRNGQESLAYGGRSSRAGILDVRDRHLGELETTENALAEYLTLIEV